MSPRNPELPEGTDHIINGALETGERDYEPVSSDVGFGGVEMGMGGSGATAGAEGGNEMIQDNDNSRDTADVTGGFVASSGNDDTGGTASTGSLTGGNIKAQLKDGASGLQAQAGEKIRAFAETGKGRATTALDDLTQMVNDAASEIDQRLGAEYGEYARRAADAVSGFADTIRGKEVDELFEDGKNLVRKSPGVALGVAAVVGFTLVRVVKAGLEAPAPQREVEFEPSPQLGAGNGTGTTGTTNIGA